MITKLVRISSRISFQVIGSRKYTISNKLLPKIDFLHNKSCIGNSTSVGIRLYSDVIKQDTNQIEAKILDIIRNFDRVKENSANPQVIN